MRYNLLEAFLLSDKSMKEFAKECDLTSAHLSNKIREAANGFVNKHRRARIDIEYSSKWCKALPTSVMIPECPKSVYDIRKNKDCWMRALVAYRIANNCTKKELMDEKLNGILSGLNEEEKTCLFELLSKNK